MARISKEPHNASSLGRTRPQHVQRRLSKGAANPTLIPNTNIVVRVASFEFRFESVDHLRECLAFFEKKIHPSSRIPVRELRDEFGEDWRKLRGWEVERWFERLPMYLLENSRRQKVVKALRKTLELAENGKL